LIALGIFGAALLYGDGMITAAITVLGAVEGLTVATPLIYPYVVPIAVVILIGIFAIQQHGTDRVGRLFGPVMVLWFVTIAYRAYRVGGRGQWQPSISTAPDVRCALTRSRWCSGSLAVTRSISGTSNRPTMQSRLSVSASAASRPSSSTGGLRTAAAQAVALTNTSYAKHSNEQRR
jgi:hypothetical protein